MGTGQTAWSVKAEEKQTAITSQCAAVRNAKKTRHSYTAPHRAIMYTIYLVQLSWELPEYDNVLHVLSVQGHCDIPVVAEQLKFNCTLFASETFKKILLDASIIHRLTCNSTFHKTYHLFTDLKVIKIHYMFRPTWPSSDDKNISNEEIADFPCCWCWCVCVLWFVCYVPPCCVLRCVSCSLLSFRCSAKNLKDSLALIMNTQWRHVTAVILNIRRCSSTPHLMFHLSHEWRWISWQFFHFAGQFQ
jgi:hypothetical protein